MAPSYTLDLSGYRPSISDTVDDDRYLAMVDDYELTKAKSSGNDMFVVYLRILEGPYMGSVIIDRLTTTGKGLFKIVGFLNGLGQPTPKKRLSINPEAWKNKKVYIDTSKSEPYRGRPGTSQVDGYSRYVADGAPTDAAPVEAVEAPAEPETVEVPYDEANSIENDMAAPEVAATEPVKSFETATTAAAEPEMLSLSDISL
jgi:hypothetical protein